MSGWTLCAYCSQLTHDFCAQCGGCADCCRGVYHWADRDAEPPRWSWAAPGPRDDDRDAAA